MELADIDLCNPERFATGIPHDEFKLLRQRAPVFWHRETNGTGFWAITRYHDVVAVSRDTKTFSSAKKAVFVFDPEPEELEHMQLMMLNMDPPRHTKLRALVNKGFTPRMVARLEPHIRDIANDIIDGVAKQGRCDFVAQVAAELPLQVIAELLGIPLEDRGKVFDWSNRLIGFDDPEYQSSAADGQQAATEMYVYANQLAVARRDNPGDDLVSVLMNAEVDGEKLTELEFDLFFLLLAVAGNETTRNLISGGMLALIQHPDQRARLLAKPALMPTAVEEMLRWVSPVIEFRRTATRDTELRGQTIRDGDKVLIYYVSANRDEEVFPEPDRFDVGRTPNDHLAFGIGEHFCLGSNLARLEIRIMFEELLRRLPDIELAGPVDRLQSNLINGIKRMPVQFTPAPRVKVVAA
jgi:cholest-4-en-3-one 26-monooxygenase